MKKIALIISALTLAYCVQAQKIGYFNSTDVLKDNPSVKKIDSSVNTYLETLKVGYTYLQDEYNDKINKLKDTAIMIDAKKSLLIEDVTSLKQKLNSYQNDATQKLTQKRNELYGPITKKVTEIVNELAKDGKYDFIFDVNSTAIFYVNKSNDLTEIIKKKLK